MERDGFACLHCASAAKTLNVHHVNYDKGKAPWDYDEDNFITLCADCHSMLEARIRILRGTLALDKNAGMDVITFSSARMEEGPYNEFARVFATWCAEAIREAEAAIWHSFEDEETEAQCSSDLALVKAAKAVWCLQEYMDKEMERQSQRKARRTQEVAV